jgi:hypothetical protein
MVPLVYESYNVNTPSLIRSPKSYLVIVLAKTWAIPGPIVPAPITATFVIPYHLISKSFQKMVGGQSIKIGIHGVLLSSSLNLTSQGNNVKFDQHIILG